jgi:hypothetical protein
MIVEEVEHGKVELVEVQVGGLNLERNDPISDRPSASIQKQKSQH